MVAVGFLFNSWLYSKTFLVCFHDKLRPLVDNYCGSLSLRCLVQTSSEHNKSPWERWLWEEPFPIMQQETDCISSSLHREGIDSACPQRFHGTPHWPNIRHRVKKQHAGFSQHVSPGSSLIKSSHVWHDNVFFYCLNSHLPHVSREGRRITVDRLGVILQLFGLGQDGVDIWDGVILKATLVKDQNHSEQVNFGNNISISKCEALGFYVSLCNSGIKSLTCSNLIFTVKSPASNLSRMSLWKEEVNRNHDSHEQSEVSMLLPNRKHNLKSSHEHGTADQDEEVESVLVRKQGVPDTDDIWQEKLLR